MELDTDSAELLLNLRHSLSTMEDLKIFRVFSLDTDYDNKLVPENLPKPKDRNAILLPLSLMTKGRSSLEMKYH